MARCSCGEGVMPGARTCMGGCVQPVSVSEVDTLRREVSRLREAMRAALDEASKLDGPRACRIAVLLTDALREE